MDLTLKNVPDWLHRRLREIAAGNHRSLSSEIIQRLERSVGAVPADTEPLAARASRLREQVRLPHLTDEALRAAREDGR